MTKFTYLLWSRVKHDPAQRREVLLEQCAPKMLDTGLAGLQMNIADDEATTPSPAPTPPFSEPFIAQVNIWCSNDSDEQRLTCQDILRAAGFELAGYRCDEWLYTDYGENPNAPGERDWPDGQRSPGILSVNVLRKPRRLTHETWMRRWFGAQSPMSEWMQPRARYVRNVIEGSVTPGAEDIAGIVEEAWPTGEHVTNKMLFYGAKSRLQLARHMGIMLKTVASFLPMMNITTVMTSEYFIKTPPTTRP